MALPFEFGDLDFTPLSADCPRGAFSCGDETVDKWFQEHAIRRHNKYDCRVTVVHRADDPCPVAFFALSMKAVNQGLLNKTLVENLFSTYKDYFPALEIKWIAVREEFRGNKLGRFLMGLIINEFHYAIEKYGCQAMVLEAIDQRTEEFYYKLGFRRYGPPVLKRWMLLGAKPVLEMIRQTEAN